MPMAVADEVVVELKAQTETYNRKIDVAAKQFETRMRSLSDAAAKAGKASELPWVAAERAADKAAAAMEKDAARANRALGATRANMGNLAAQFQDIGVQLATGASPFTVIAQQVPQVAAATGSLRGVVAGLGAAFAQVLSPVGLATTAFILVGSVAAQYFSTLFEDTDKSAKELKAQAALIQDLAKEWGDAVPGIKAYADQMERAANIRGLVEGGKITVDEIFKRANTELESMNSSFPFLIQQIRAMGASEDQIKKIEDAFGRMSKAIEEQKDGSADAAQIALQLATIFGSNMSDAVDNLANRFKNFILVLSQVSEAARKVQGDVQKAIAPEDPRRFDTNTVILPNEAPTPDRRVDPYFDGPEKTKREGKTPEQKFQDAIQDSQRRIELLRVETNAQQAAAAGYDDYGFAVARAREQQRLLQAAQEAGLTITPQLIDSIGVLATEFATLEAQQNRNTKAQADLNREQKQFAEFSKDVLGGFIRDLRAGKSAAEALANALDKVADKLLDMALNEIFGDGGPLDGILKSVFSALGGAGGKGGGGTDIAGMATNIAKAASGTITKAGEAAAKVVTGGIAKTAWDFFSGKGLGDHQVAAILGHINAESAFNPRAIGDAGSAFGLFQHHAARGGGLGLLNSGATGQLQHAWNELNGSESGVLANLRASTNVRDAVKAFGGFERPRGYSAANPEAMDNFTGRLKGAEDALAKFGGTTQGATSALADGTKQAVGGLDSMASGMNSFSNMLSQFAMSPAGGGSGGWFSGLASMFGGNIGAFNFMNSISPAATNFILGGGVGLFDDGGYTGAGGRNQVAGVVHAGEVVFSQADVKRLGGVGVVEAIRRGGMRGYAAGGPVIPRRGDPRVYGPWNGGGWSGGPRNTHDNPLGITIMQQIDARGTDAAAIARLEAQFHRQREELPATVISAVRKGQKLRRI